MARVIGEAAIRLTIDSKTLATSLKGAFKTAAKEASAGGGLFDGIDKDSDRVGKSVESRFSGLFSRLTAAGKGFASSLGSVLSTGLALGTLGLKAGAAVAGVGALVQGLGGLVTVLTQVSGVAALLPAIFAGILAVTTTLKIGLSGVSDAFKALGSGDAAALDAALKKLAPSAQAFVKQAQAIKPAFDAMKLDVQQKLFDGLGQSLKVLAASYLPVLKNGFSGIATELNGAAKGVATFLSQGSSISSVSTIFDNVRAAVKALSPALTAIVSAFVDLGTVGSTFLPGLATGITGVAEKFASFINTARQTGQLQSFIQNAINVLKQLGDIAKNVFGIIGDILGAGEDAGGGGTLNTLQQITGALRDFTSSASGHQILVTFFTQVGAAVKALLPVFTGLVSIVVGQVAPVLLSFVTTLGPVLQGVLGPLGIALNAALPGITALGNGIAAFVAGIAPALPAVGALVAVLGQGLGQVMAALGPVIGQLAQVLATTLATAIPPLIPIITQLVQIVGQILTAVAPLIGPILQLVSAALGPLLTIVQALLPPFTLLIQSVLKALQPVIPVIAQAFTQLGTALAPLAGALGNALVQIFVALTPILQPLAGLFLQLVTAIIPLLGPITTLITILGQIISIVATVVAAIIGFIANAITPLVAIFGVLNSVVSGAMNAILSVISGVIGVVSSIFTGLVTTVSNVWGQITGAISSAVNKVASFISNGFNTAVNAVRNAFSSIVSAVSSGVNNAVNFVAGLAGRILSAIGNFGSLLYNAGKDLLTGLINGISAMIGHVINSVIDVGKKILSGIKGALGISSPSKEMAKIGVFVGQGLIKGMEQITPAVNSAAASMGDGVLNQFALPTAQTGVPKTGTSSTVTPAQVGSSSFQQNNYMLPGTDVRQFAATVLDRANVDLSSGASTLPVQRQGVQFGVNDQWISGVTM